MEPTTLALLQRGRIPVEPIFNRVIAYTEKCDIKRTEDEAHELLFICERQGLNYATIARLLYKYRHNEVETQSLDFNTADRLLCGMFMWDEWYSDEVLNEWYHTVDLTWKQCELDDCQVMFRYFPRSHRKYCSRSCRDSASNIATGRTHRTVKALREHNSKKCRNGHTRTEENTFTRANGKTECRLCMRATNRASYHKRKKIRPTTGRLAVA